MRKYFIPQNRGWTTAPSRNAIKRTNVKTEPKKDFRACHDLFELVVHCQIIAAALTHLNMEKKIYDIPSVVPNPTTVWMLQDDQERIKLYTIL